MLNIRQIIAVLLLVAVAACTVMSPEPGPEAQRAAKRISSDITQYRNGEAPATNPREPSGMVHGANLFAEVYEQVRVHYVREVNNDALIAAATSEVRKRHPNPAKANDQELVEAAIHGMLASLDNYSTYLDRAHLRALREQTRGRFGGLGIEVKKGDTYIEIVSPIDGTPAARAGLKSGDKITKADGRLLKEMLLRDAVLLLRGPPGSKVRLTLQRGKQKPFDVTIERAVINIAAVRWRTEGDIGYVRITSFSEKAGDEVAGAIVEVKKKLGSRMRGLVLDLRNNPGGLLDQSIKISDIFLNGGRIVSTRERNFEHHYNASGGDLVEGVPIVVLVNNGSASAAEIVAGALRDHRRATLVGNKTFGKGTVQTIIPLHTSDAVKLTTAIYLTPSGKSVEGGINPHYEVTLDDKHEGDEQLQQALRLLAGATVAVPGRTSAH